jgi:hypothetical protein
MTFASRLVDGLPERCSLSVNVRPSEVVKPLFDLHSTYCIIAKSLLNLPDCFRFGTSKLLTKLDSLLLLHAFSHYLAKRNAMSTYYSTSHTSCLGEKDAPGEAAKNHACARRSPHRDQICQPAVTGFSGKK